MPPTACNSLLGSHVPPVGTTVDGADTAWTNPISATELIAVWTDPDFRPGGQRGVTAFLGVNSQRPRPSIVILRTDAPHLPARGYWKKLFADKGNGRQQGCGLKPTALLEAGQLESALRSARD